MTSEEYAKLAQDMTAAAMAQNVPEFDRLSTRMLDYLASMKARHTEVMGPARLRIVITERMIAKEFARLTDCDPAHVRLAYDIRSDRYEAQWHDGGPQVFCIGRIPAHDLELSLDDFQAKYLKGAAREFTKTVGN